jgi:hypothetical protein
MESGSTICLVRRFLVIAALMFWLGGFTFYSAVVVHVGHQVLGSQLDQGLVTQSVTNYLNLGGLVAVVLWAWDIARTRNCSVRLRRVRWAIWGVLASTLGLLAWLHLKLDEHIVTDSPRILDRPHFRGMHKWYLHISTFQWAGGLLLTLLTLLAWRSEDREGRFFSGSRSEIGGGCKRTEG